MSIGPSFPVIHWTRPKVSGEWWSNQANINIMYSNVNEGTPRANGPENMLASFYDYPRCGFLNREGALARYGPE